MDNLSVHDITSINDDLLLDWLALYETSFSPDERILIADILQILEQTNRGEQPPFVIQALVNADGKLIGLSMYHIFQKLLSVYAYYFAIIPELRNQGIGMLFYHKIVERIFQNYTLMLYEVELPEEADNDDERKLRERRISFYRRNGAKMLNGISYYQSVGHGEPIPMAVMVHLQNAMSAQQVFELAREILGDSINSIDSLSLS